MVKTDMTIVYYTDNSLEDRLFKKCQELLVKAADGKPIISVSQKPIDFGENICVGEIGRSHLSLFKQILVGVERVKTKYLALAEHDCLYTPEHFDWTPKSNDKFYYNINHWFAHYSTGIYSYFRRKVLSMMVANTELTIKAARDKVLMLENGAMIQKGQPGACEFGVCANRKAYVDYLASIKDFGKDIGSYRAASFSTKYPNIDIRHGNNFSGNRRTTDTSFSLPYWGEFANIIKDHEGLNG